MDRPGETAWRWKDDYHNCREWEEHRNKDTKEALQKSERNRVAEQKKLHSSVEPEAGASRGLAHAPESGKPTRLLNCDHNLAITAS
ncbi:UPF0545 protein C22orf39 homolog isoform X1 [Melanotaenia boesemani]|uniref:UPF0545 protein C22orf39 homolog isoform X1 n=1 Tax=Melanotaenia boesemani TaxID=1250792 RepID=UPI001C051BA9|nr:UPF0545 protein C22orf39 homolog isoform X1 [Melanotaenia boesemani]